MMRLLFLTAFALGTALACEPATPVDGPPVDILGTEKKLYSQADEELIIRDFFQDRREGFFVDVGSADYKRNSTTYYLEKHLDWSGIAIDGIPEYKSDYAAHRPRTRFFNYIVTDHSGTIDEFYRVKGVPDLSSTIKDRKWDGKLLPAETIRVPSITLNDLLKREGVEEIDFMSMDIERGAPKALAAFDIDHYKPRLICIEAGAGEDYHRIIAGYFAEHDYERIDRYLKHDWANWYYQPKP
jgi:hypothetical protein